MQDDVAFDNAVRYENNISQFKRGIDWDGRLIFEYTEWMEKYFDDNGHYPPPMQCYLWFKIKINSIT